MLTVRVVRVGICCCALAVVAAATGAQTFTRHKRSYPVGPNPCAIVAHDLNGDGKPEIVTADRGVLVDPSEEKPANDELSVLTAGEDLSYTRQTLRAGFAPYCIEVANIDARKAPDLVVGSFYAVRGQNLSLFRNLTDNLVPVYFSLDTNKFRYHRMYDSDDHPVFPKPGITALTVRDIDHDGFRDVIATGWSSDTLIFYPGHADAYFAEPKVYDAPGGPRDIEHADFDRDGETDLVTTMYVSGEVVLWKGDGTGAFTEADRFLSGGPLPHRVAVADMNRDGRLDLVVSHRDAADSIVIFFGARDFSFPVSQEVVFAEADDMAASRAIIEKGIRDILVADLNGDGAPDIAAACQAAGDVTVLLATSGEGAMPVEFHEETYRFQDGQPSALCAADFNGDDKRDLGVAVWGKDANRVSLLLGK
ncbi:MAG: hypothetical protein GY851_25315 [bacterium]|nr:hypothetical protein [bacterium]